MQSAHREKGKGFLEESHVSTREWRNLNLGQVITLQRGHDLPAGERQLGTVPVMGSAGLTGYHNISKAKGPGVTIGRSGVGSMGVVSYCPTDYWPHNTVLYVTDFKGNYPLFIYYFLKTANLRRFDSGSAQASLNRNYLYPLAVRVPPASEQIMIGDALGALDDKIELNRRTNATLEALARALFQSWFVDFDPVRAKAEGRRPAGVDAATAALFPDRFEDSALGEVPQGWRVSEIGAEVEVVGGSTPSTAEAAYWEGGTIDWATPKDLSGLDAPVLLNTARRITDAGLQQIGSGLLPAGTVLLSSRAPVGYLALADIPLAINQGFIAMKCDAQLPNTYVLNWAKANMETIEGRANGTTFMEVSKANFRTIPVIVPRANVLQVFQQTVMPWYEKIAANLREAQTLAELRDTLLPKLMSGEVRVREHVESEGRTPGQQASAEAYQRHLRLNDFWRRGRK